MFGKQMKQIEEDEKDIEIPNDDDENVGEEAPKKKKRKKSREERIAERKVIFWTLLVVLIITFGFWLVPKIGRMFKGEAVEVDDIKNSQLKPSQEKKENSKYMEITL
jgi:hypothetical protein